MKKRIVRLTESDLEKLVKRIIKEDKTNGYQKRRKSLSEASVKGGEVAKQGVGNVPTSIVAPMPDSQMFAALRQLAMDIKSQDVEITKKESSVLMTVINGLIALFKAEGEQAVGPIRSKALTMLKQIASEVQSNQSSTGGDKSSTGEDENFDIKD